MRRSEPTRTHNRQGGGEQARVPAQRGGGTSVESEGPGGAPSPPGRPAGAGGEGAPRVAAVEETVTSMDEDPFSPWGLRPVELSDAHALGRYFASLAEPLSDYTFSQ